MRLIYAMLLVVGCGEAAPEAPAERDLSSRLTFEAVKPVDRVPVAALPAEVLPAPDSAHALGPAVDGRLVRWHVQPGQTVAAGEPLAELRSPELAGLESRAAELKTTVGQQTRVRDLRIAAARRGVASQADLREAEGALIEATAALDAVRSQLRASRDTTTRTGGGGWTWRSPVDGVVDTITCSLGSVSPEATCLTLVNPEGVVLQVRVPERHLSRLTGPVVAEFTAADGRSWTMAELGRSPVIDVHSRTQTLRFGVGGTDLPLQGASGWAALSVAGTEGLWQVPLAALTRIDGEPVVFVQDAKGGAVRGVTIVGQDAERVVVTGLQATDKVAVRGVFLLKSLTLLEDPS